MCEIMMTPIGAYDAKFHAQASILQLGTLTMSLYDGTSIFHHPYCSLKIHFCEVRKKAFDLFGIQK